MKYLKISSLLVLSLLLFAPQALADAECEVRPNNQRVRMESEMEMLETLSVLCTWTGDSGIGVTDPDPSATPATMATGTMFDIELQFSGDILNDDGSAAKMPVTLWLKDLDAVTDGSTRANVDEDGNRIPAPVATVDSDTVYWEDVVFPASWTTTATGRGTFDIAGIYIDATSVSSERLQVTLDMSSSLNDVGGTPQVLSADNAPVAIARVDQALDLSLTGSQKAQAFNSCEPEKKTINVTLEEGFRMAWDDDNDIKLMTSSGGIKASDSGVFDVTAEGGTGELIIDVTPTNSDDSGSLAIEFAPAAGGAVGDDITLTAMILPARRTKEMFAASATLVVGSYSACEGDSLFFPFVTSMSGWDTGIVVVNDSKVDGSCSLNWGNMDLDDYEMDALSTIDVDAKGHTAFLVSGQRGADYSGSVGVMCSFSSATGYVFLSDAANGIGQGYLVNPMP